MKQLNGITSALNADQPYNAVILDLNVTQGMNGLEASRRIAGLNPEASMIVTSGFGNDPILLEYSNFGFKARLTKPFNFDALIQAVKTALDQ